MSLQSWALPPCPSSQNAYYHNCYGTYEWISGKFKGDKYFGEFKDNKKDGQGIYAYANGEKYVGEYKDDSIHGQGTYTWSNGAKYVGEYKDGKRHGQGAYTWADGRKDVGEFRNDLLNGFAIRYDRNGNILKEGIWKDDEFQYSQKKSSSSSNSSSKLNKYKRFCETIGFSLGTTKFAECVLEAMKKG